MSLTGAAPGGKEGPMKRFGAVLLVLALVLCVCLLGPRLLKKVGADLGSFSGSSDYGGDSSSSGWDNGSSWDSGSGWDGGSSWDSGGNGFFFFPVGSSSSSDSGDSSGFGNLLFYVVLIIILIMIFSRKNQHQATPHPNFSESDLVKKLSNIYVQMQNGCTARNIESLRPYFTDALYQQFDRQIKSLIASHRINRVDRIAVLDVVLRGWFQEGGDDHLVALLKTRITDYIVDEDTGKVISGSDTAEKFMTYEWDLSRPTGTVTEQAGEVTERHCPNCGAPLSVNESAKCPYCDTVLTFQDHDWTIYAVKGIAQRTVQS